MDSVFQKFIDESKNYDQKIIYDEIQDERIRTAIDELKIEGYTPVLCNTQAVLDEYYGDKLSDYEYIVTPEGENPTMYAGKMHAEGKVDGFISGAVNTTGDTLRALIKNTGSAEGVKRISGYFLMDTHRGLNLVADCAVQPNPNAEQLAEIAYLSAKTAMSFGMEPKIGMLSFSTKGSAVNEMSQKVIDATALAKARFEEEGLADKVQIEGELQLDAAIVPRVAEQKVKDGSWGGEANVLVFPDLNSGNIGYKLIQYYGRAQAIGPLIQGLNKPGNDLSRGCSVDDIKVLHAITVIQAEKASK